MLSTAVAGKAVVSLPADVVAHQKEQKAYTQLFWAMLLLFEAFLFTLPLFPNGDGPVHVYLSAILGKLIARSSPLYAHFYSIRHLVQPYSFHYYLLILLERFLSIDTAEKVFVGLIWATLAIGFRTLAFALGPCAGAASLLVFPLLLSWPLSAGFFNFTFGIGLLLFALSLYVRLATTRTPGKLLAALGAVLVVLVLAHPIPILVLICLAGIDLGLQLLGGWQQRRSIQLQYWQCAALVLACLAFVFPVVIADKTAVADSVRTLRPDFTLLILMLTGQYVAYFKFKNVFGVLCQFIILFLLPLSVMLQRRSGLAQRLRAGLLSPADRLMVSVLVFLLASLVFPATMNGSAYFAVRMWYIVWLVSSACVATAVMRDRSQRLVAGFGAIAGLLFLILGLIYIRPEAHKQAALERAPIPPNARGLFLSPPNGVEGDATHTFWATPFWEGARAFATHNDVLLNTPWLQLTIVPVQEQGRAGLMRDVTPNGWSENASYLPERLESHRDEEAAVLAMADFLLLADPNSAVPNPLGLAADVLGPFASGWTCVQQDFYVICRKR